MIHIRENGMYTHIFVKQNNTNFRVSENVWAYVLRFAFVLEVPLEQFCSKTIFYLNLKLHLMVVFLIYDRNRLLSYHPRFEFMNYHRKFLYYEHLFYPHSAAQLQLGKTWTELLSHSWNENRYSLWL